MSQLKDAKICIRASPSKFSIALQSLFRIFFFLFFEYSDFISSRIHIHTTYHKPRDLIKGENSNLEKEYQSLEISNDFKKPFASFFLSHSNKNSREKKGEHTRLTETVEFGYRAFRRRSLLNKFLPSLPSNPSAGEMFR